MSPWIWVLIAVVVVVLAVLALMGSNRRRTATLRRRFGPEYDQAVQSADDRRAAEGQLQERAKRHSQLTIVALSEPARLRYAEQWREVQERFVDQPSEAVSEAEVLLARVMGERGYPVSDFDEQADLVSVDHPRMVQDYRIAHTINKRNANHQATTEELREAVLRYRSLFDELLRVDGDASSRPGTSRRAGNLREGQR